MRRLPVEFWNFLFARLFFVLGLRMITTIVIYQMFHMANTYMVGIAGLAEFIPAVADVPFSTTGMRLGKYDKSLVQNHRLLESIYWGRGPTRRYDEGNGDRRQRQSVESREAEALLTTDV